MYKLLRILKVNEKMSGRKAIGILICFILFLSACELSSSVVTLSPTSPPSGLTPVISAKPLHVPDGLPLRNGALIFQDEFSGTELNASYWTTEYRWGPVNDPELQYYSSDALEVGDGILRIKAEKRSTNGMKYRSGMIASYDRFTFTYGYVEIRAKIPAGQGLWPAFWLHLNDDSKTGEIDVFELLGHQPNVAYMTFHYPDKNGTSVDDGSWFNGPDYSQDFHTFGVDWEPDTITWYIDGIERYRATHDIPNEPMYILANLAVGDDWPGDPDETTYFPAYYDIDYIRVYKSNNP